MRSLWKVEKTELIVRLSLNEYTTLSLNRVRREFQRHAKAICAWVLLTACGCCAESCSGGSDGYHVTKTIQVGGDEGWDYVGVDSAARRVYVSHGSHVVVLDADSGKVVGDIPDTQGVHGIAIAPDAGRGFTSNGRANTVTVFDLKTLKTQGTVKAGTNPDAIVYDPATNRVFTMNGRSQDTTAINVADSTVAGTLALGGNPNSRSPTAKEISTSTSRTSPSWFASIRKH